MSWRGFFEGLLFGTPREVELISCDAVAIRIEDTEDGVHLRIVRPSREYTQYSGPGVLLSVAAYEELGQAIVADARRRRDAT